MAKTKSSNSKADTESLQARLADREQLVEELTSRLEQAAEQLDRFKRTGADRGGRIINGGGGLPASLVEQQQTLTEELQQAVRDWENMQPTVLLSRVEMQITELRDLMFERGDGMAVPAPTKETSSASASQLTKPSSTPTDNGSTNGDVDPSGMSLYEQFKAGLTGDEPPADESNASSVPTESASESAPTAEAAARPVEAEIPAVDPPEEIDLESADEEALREAVHQRDSYITYLLRRLRAKEVAAWPAGEWKDLEGVPGELAVRLEEYEKQLEELLRLAEVETSLERARLGREAAKLELERQQIQSVMSHLQLSEECEDDVDDADDEGDSNGRPKPSRLKRFLARWQGDEEPENGDEG